MDYGVASGQGVLRAIHLKDDEPHSHPHLYAVNGLVAARHGDDPIAGSEQDSTVSPAARMAYANDLIATKDLAGAIAVLDLSLLPSDAPMDVQLAWAEHLALAQAHELSDGLFETLLGRFPKSPRVRFAYARRLHARGEAFRAADMVEPIAETYPPQSQPHIFIRHVLRFREILQAREDLMIPADADCRLLAMKHAIAAYRSRSVRILPKDRIGRLTFITGSLGPGGAERQLSRTAAELERARVRDGHAGGIMIERPIEVIVRSHGPEQQHDFFLADLQAANVELAEVNHMPAYPISSIGVEDEDLEVLLENLPLKVSFGVRRLVEHFRRSQPDVVSIWQDGACLFAGLAAVIAGVPRVQLVIRGLPPVIRKHMFLPEYELMYRELAAVPGVEFVSNSRAAARAYADWLDVPVDRFAIVYNGVQKMECPATEVLEALWAEFEARTPGASHTIGGVFRFDTDKRPVLWIRFAANYFRRHPQARFVLVGDGRLFDEAHRVASELGVVDRILFVGRSSEVGYWMRKMDVLVLMSSFEGLPNVLIEAQYLGVPVVSTPAGGASECFIEGVTGHILGCADKTCLDETCDKTRALVGRAQDEAIFGPATRNFLEPNFAVGRMLENFLRTACKADAA